MWKKQTLINLYKSSLSYKISWFNKHINQRILKLNIYSNVKETNIDQYQLYKSSLSCKNKSIN